LSIFKSGTITSKSLFNVGLSITGGLTLRLPSTLNKSSIFFFFSPEDDDLPFFNPESIVGFPIEP
jgi:hypothetical protein